MPRCCHPFFLVLMTLMLAFAGTLPALAQDKPKPDPTRGTWHIGLDKLWGVDKKDQGKRLDIYPVFVERKWVNALATARSFNTSIHLIEESDVTVDPDAGTVKGKLKILITPDTWIPSDGQPFHIEATLDGQLKPQDDGAILIGGTYTAKRTDGKPLYDDVTTVEANLIGGVGITETGWDNSVWSLPLNQVAQPGGIDMDLIVFQLGIADGKVNWGRVGLASNPKFPASYWTPIDVSAFGPVSEAGIAQGSLTLTGRHLHVGGDPNTRYRVDLTARRVQGLAGAKAVITPLDDKGQPAEAARLAAGRGTCSKGGGSGDAPANIWSDALNTDPWFVPVKNHAAVQPGEHPRLLFRKSDLPELRKRAQTEEGKAILARLRALLGNDGEAVPTRFNPEPADNHDKSPNLPIGTFTTWHAAGFGFLYQITGDTKYADLSRQCVQFMLDGKMDIDNRYGWSKPGTQLRCGSVLAAMAYAYDFCYDAWPQDFRQKIALEIQNFDKVTASAEDGAGDKPASTVDIKRLAGRSGYPPGSNHYGSIIGGTGVAMLAIQGDPGVDNEFVQARLGEIESNIPRMLALGFGDAGFYAEGLPPSRLSSNGGFLELLHALRTAAGRDYIDSPRRNAQWITLRWIMHLGGNGYAQYPNRGTYGNDSFYGKGGLSGGGDFAFGFGSIPQEYQPALLWTYKTYVEPFEQGKYSTTGNELTYNAQFYPHRAIYSFLHWPIDTKPVNPSEVLPHVVADTVHGYIIARNRWQDSDDIIVTTLLDLGPRGYYRVQDGKQHHDRPGVLRVWGHGLRTTFSTGMGETSPTHFTTQKDGSFSLTTRTRGGLTGLVVDYSKASGADLVIVAVGPGATDSRLTGKDKPAKNDKASTTLTQLKLDGTPVYILTMQTADAPKPTVEGNTIKVGNQTYTWDGKTLTTN